jgi:Zn-dependent protease with chaperone function
MAQAAICLVLLFSLFLIYVLFGTLVIFFTGAEIDQEASLRLNFNNIYIVNNSMPFAFALSSKKILIATGLRNLLNRQELQSIVARELFNISQHKTGVILAFDLTSWKREFAADTYAAQVTGDPETLITAITKIGRVSSIFPPVEDRIKLLRAM